MLGTMAHTGNPSHQEAEKEGLQDQDQPERFSLTLFLKIQFLKGGTVLASHV